MPQQIFSRILPALAACLVLASGCNGLPMGSSAATGRQCKSGIDGVYACVDRIAKNGNVYEASFTVINGRKRSIEIGSKSGDAIAVRDGSGASFKARTPNTFTLQPYTVAQYHLVFDAPKFQGNQLALLINPEYNNDYDRPALTFDNLPIGNAPAPTAVGSSSRHVSVQTPGGVFVQVRQVEATTTGINVQLVAVNGRKDSIKLNGDDSDPMFISDGTGLKYLLTPSASNSALEIPAHQKLTATLHFPGFLPAGAGQLTLAINNKYGSTDAWTTHPQVTLPLPSLESAAPAATKPAQ